MSYKLRTNRDQILSKFPMEMWPLIDKSTFYEKETEPSKEGKINVLTKFNLREASVVAYLNAEPLQSIREKYGFSRQFVHRLVLKCITTHPDGKIWGFRALLPFEHLKRYDRMAKVKTYSNQGGMSGALMQLFEQYPDIQDVIEAFFFKKADKLLTVHETVISFKSIHKRFIDACRGKGIKATEYPFTAKWMGYYGLVKV